MEVTHSIIDLRPLLDPRWQARTSDKYSSEQNFDESLDDGYQRQHGGYREQARDDVEKPNEQLDRHDGCSVISLNSRIAARSRKTFECGQR
jgi:hypothetical protein